jgi:hypothetical protein
LTCVLRISVTAHLKRGLSSAATAVIRPVNRRTVSYPAPEETMLAFLRERLGVLLRSELHLLVAGKRHHVSTLCTQ